MMLSVLLIHPLFTMTNTTTSQARKIMKTIKNCERRESESEMIKLGLMREHEGKLYAKGTIGFALAEGK